MTSTSVTTSSNDTSAKYDDLQWAIHLQELVKVLQQRQAESEENANKAQHALAQTQSVAKSLQKTEQALLSQAQASEKLAQEVDERVRATFEQYNSLYEWTRSTLEKELLRTQQQLAEQTQRMQTMEIAFAEWGRDKVAFQDEMSRWSQEQQNATKQQQHRLVEQSTELTRLHNSLLVQLGELKQTHLQKESYEAQETAKTEKASTLQEHRFTTEQTLSELSKRMDRLDEEQLRILLPEVAYIRELQRDLQRELQTFRLPSQRFSLSWVYIVGFLLALLGTFELWFYVFHSK